MNTYLLFFLETVDHLQIGLLDQLLVDFKLIRLFVLVELLDKCFLAKVVVFLMEFVGARVESLFRLYHSNGWIFSGFYFVCH